MEQARQLRGVWIVAGGALQIPSREAEMAVGEVGTFDLRADVLVSLPADEKYLLRVFIAPPTRLYGLEISRVGAE